jgi:pyruvate/2-oxoglutarate dehydrogenase complex dihydrolipoamide acyltransferase (E2) component
MAHDPAPSGATTKGRLQFEDIDRWLDSRENASDYKDYAISARQKLLGQRLVRSLQQIVPAALDVECHWNRVEEARAIIRAHTSNRFIPGRLELLAWCVVRAIEKHPRFRSAIIGGNTIREYAHLCLGIAVGLPDDGLAVAPIPDADRLSFHAFVGAVKASVHDVRNGQGEAGIAQFTISRLTGHGIISSQPVIVSPAIATLFIGDPYEACRRGPDDSVKWEKACRLVLSFDHRLINGVGAGRFISEVQRNIDRLPAQAPILAESL